MRRPTVTLKLATSLDGRIAMASGESRWITGPEARAEVHRMRGDHDVVLTGIGTVLADDPLMTARTDPPPARQPLRAVLDTKGRCPVTAALLKADDRAPLVLVGPEGKERTRALQEAGAQVLEVPLDPATGRISLPAALDVLAGEGALSVMVEAGGTLAGACIRAGIVDRIVWFRAPVLLGAPGRPVLDDLGLARLADAPRFQRVAVGELGAALMETYLAVR